MRNKVDVRTVNRHGQISIGKELAGQQVQIERQDNGTFLIKKGQFIPDNERWLYENDNINKIEEAIIASKKRPLSDNFEEVKKRILADE